MDKNKIKEKFINYIELLTGDKICPSCGEKARSSRRDWLTAFAEGYKCRNCGSHYKYTGKIAVISRILIVFYFILGFVYIININNVPKKESFITFQVVLVIIILWEIFIAGPFKKITLYNSTPLDDLINSFRKLKALDKKGKMKVAVVAAAVVFAFVGIGIYINHWTNVKNNLSNLTYDVVQESCDNYGDYSKSKYKDIVSEEIYKNMNYFYEKDCTDKNNLEIFFSDISDIEPHILTFNTAEVNYYCDVRYKVNAENSRDIVKHPSYTVQWVLEDNAWRVSDFAELL